MKKKVKNEIIRNLKIESMAAEGKCVAHSEGKVIFLKGTAPGDIVDAKITQSKKAFSEAFPVHFHKKSSERTEPFCSHFDYCGGCKWQHINYNTQLRFKEQQVIDQLQRIGKLKLPEVSPIIPSDKTTLYRNKLEFTFTPKRWLTKEEIQSGMEHQRKGIGFHAPGRFDKVIDIEQCHLQPEPSNELRLFVKFFAINNGLSFYDIPKNKGFLRNLIIRTTDTGEIMVILQVGEKKPEEIELICNEINKTFPEITSLNYVINTKGNEIFHDLEVHNHSGLRYITEILDGIKYRIGPKSFFQTNTAQALQLYRQTKVFASLTGNELVYDLYTGAGSIANFVAGDARKVIGIDSVEASIADAWINSEINGIDNTHFLAGDIKELLNDAFILKNGKPDIIITDPPRAGMHGDVVNAILDASPGKIIYISCNPATQARDLQLMMDDYDINAVQPLDMFPHSHHVENIVLLKKK